MFASPMDYRLNSEDRRIPFPLVLKSPLQTLTIWTFFWTFLPPPLSLSLSFKICFVWFICPKVDFWWAKIPPGHSLRVIHKICEHINVHFRSRTFRKENECKNNSQQRKSKHNIFALRNYCQQRGVKNVQNTKVDVI